MEHEIVFQISFMILGLGGLRGVYTTPFQLNPETVLYLLAVRLHTNRISLTKINESFIIVKV